MVMELILMSSDLGVSLTGGSVLERTQFVFFGLVKT